MDKQKRFRLPRPRAVFLLIFLAFLIIIFIGLLQTSLTLTIYEITSDTIPQSLDGYKIVHISDFHSGRFYETAEDVVKLAAEQKPDIICLTGDIVDGRTQDFAPVEALVAGLVKIAPVYAVSGNNERYAAHLNTTIKIIYEKYGVSYIDGKKITIYDKGTAITLFGIADPGGDKDKLGREILTLKENYNDGGFGIILYHRADEFDQLTGMEYSLVLSGHLHGGLVYIPFVGGLLSPSNVFFPKYSGGLYEKNGIFLVSNRGIGNNHPIPRVYNPPEVAVVILRAGNK